MHICVPESSIKKASENFWVFDPFRLNGSVYGSASQQWPFSGWPGWLAPAFPPVFSLISRSVRLNEIYSRYVSGNKILNDLKTFWRQFWWYSQAYVGFDMFKHSNLIFITTENHHAGETFMLTPLLFSWPRSGPSSFFILESPLLFNHGAGELLLNSGISRVLGDSVVDRLINAVL